MPLISISSQKQDWGHLVAFFEYSTIVKTTSSSNETSSLLLVCNKVAIYQRSGSKTVYAHMFQDITFHCHSVKPTLVYALAQLSLLPSHYTQTTDRVSTMDLHNQKAPSAISAAELLIISPFGVKRESHY